MKILFICHSLSRNGGTLAMLQEIEKFQEQHQDIQIEVLSQEEGPLMETFQKICPTRCIHYRLIHLLKRKLWEKLFRRPYLFGYNKRQFDLVYANTVFTYQTAYAFKKTWGIPVIMHVHEASNSDHSTSSKKELISKFDTFIAASELTKKHIMTHYGIDPSRISIQYPVSYYADKFIQASTNREARQNGSQVIIGLCGQYSWVKGSDLMPLVIKHFFNRHPDAPCHFNIIARYHCLDRQKQRNQWEYDTEMLEIQDKVTTIQETSDPLMYYQQFDIFLVASREETFSLAAQEAALTGLPIVAFKGATGIEEWLKDKAGVFVPYLNLDILADTLYQLSMDKEMRCRMGAQCKNIVMEKTKQAANMENVIQTILKYNR